MTATLILGAVLTAVAVIGATAWTWWWVSMAVGGEE